MKKIIDICYKAILILIIICLGISLVGATFFYVNRSNNYLNPIILIIGAVIYFGILYKIYNLVVKLNIKTKKIIAILILIIQFVLLLVSFCMIKSIPKVDLVHILTEINSLNNTGKIINNTYFSVYPNNRFILMLLYNIQKININSELIFGILSCLSITVMTIFIYKAVKEMFDIDRGLLCLFITVFSPIFYLYVSYYYTDILMLPFASIIIYLMVKYKDNDKININVIYGVLIGILATTGYKIRAVCIFIVIAYFIYIVITKKFKTMLKKILPIVISMVFMLTLINKFENSFFKDINKDQEFPITHWIMMGFNEDNHGFYSKDDYKYSFSASNVEERKELNIAKLKSRINKMGIIGMTKHLTSKLVTVWCKGDYSYQKYLDLVKDYNISYRYLVEDKNIVINYLLQFSKICILFLSITSLIQILKNNEKSFVAIAIFGAILFYLIWEVCPRYGLSFLPWLIVLSSYSFSIFNFDFNKIKAHKYFKYIILTFTLILFIFYFNKYTENNIRKNIVAKDITEKIKYVTLDKENVIYQSLKLNSNFNCIKIRIDNPDILKDNNLNLELLDNSKKSLYNVLIDSNKVKSDGYIIVNLDKQYGKGIYYIKLSTSSSAKIDVYTSNKPSFDFYPEGKLVINDKEESGDLLFEISNYEKRGIYSKIEYIFIAILSLGIEYVVLFRKKDCNEK